jgi:subtilisin family serine protease
MRQFLFLLLITSAFAAIGAAQPVMRGVVMVKLRRDGGSSQFAVESAVRKMSPLATFSKVWTPQHDAARQTKRAAKSSLRGASENFSAVEASALENVYLIRVEETVDVRSLAATLKRSVDIEYAEPKYLRYTTDVPNDPLIGTRISEQNHFLYHNFFDAWDISKSDTSVVIAIVDSGVDYVHSDLSEKLWINTDEIPNNGVDDDNNGFIDDRLGWDFWYRDSLGIAVHMFAVSRQPAPTITTALQAQATTHGIWQLKPGQPSDVPT